MTGSAGSTTVAALDWGQQPTWQSITFTGISFAITLAAAFTGYYKYLERSYFLQETADSIEEQANAFALGVGEYASLHNDEKAALALFTTSGCATNSDAGSSNSTSPANRPPPAPTRLPRDARPPMNPQPGRLPPPAIPGTG